MAALLVAMSVMAVMLSVALPSWSHMIRREKEEEMIFRADQYARAINMYQRIHPGVDPTVDVLIKERFLRKKFKDPLSPEKTASFSCCIGNRGRWAHLRGRLDRRERLGLRERLDLRGRLDLRERRGADPDRSEAAAVPAQALAGRLA